MRNVSDIHNDCYVESAFDSATIATDTTTAGNIIDTAGYEALEFIVQSGTITDGAYTVLLHEGDNSALSDAVVVASANTLGSVTFALADDDTAKRVGYTGKKRYVRASIVSTATDSGGVFVGVAVKANAYCKPVANQ